MNGRSEERSQKEAVLFVLRYFGIFRYPLSADEVLGFAGVAMSATALEELLAQLRAEGAIHCFQEYYGPSADVATWVRRRKEGNAAAARILPSAIKTGRFLWHFPFVRFVGITGSLSKNMAGRQTDFDFFILTAPNRLWICRSLLHLFKKFSFLAGRQHHYCMNYFLDQSKAEIQEQNAFTAIEIATMIPVRGQTAYARLLQANAWIEHFLPNRSSTNTLSIGRAESSSGIKRSTEVLLELFAPVRVNRWLMRLTDQKWRRKWKRKNYPMEDYELAFKTTEFVSKNHPANHQKKILNYLHEAHHQEQPSCTV